MPKPDLETRFVTIQKADKAKQIVWGEVYAPDTLDSQGDFMAREWIEKMAYDFMRKGLTKSIDTEHNLEINGSAVVESFIARDNDPDFTPGSWVMGVHMPDNVWKDVEGGRINGFSMYGSGARVEKMLEMEVPDDGLLEGRVMKFDDHDHEVVLKIDEHGQLLGGETAEDNDHSHLIRKGTSTEYAGTNEHSHRFSMSDVLGTTLAKMQKSAYREQKGKYTKPEGAAGKGTTSKQSHPHLHQPTNDDQSHQPRDGAAPV